MTMILGLKIIEAKVIKECGKERNKDKNVTSFESETYGIICPTFLC